MNWNQSAFRFFPLFPGNQMVKVKHTMKQLTFYFQKPRRLSAKVIGEGSGLVDGMAEW